MNRRDYLDFGFQYECKEYRPYGHISLLPKTYGIEAMAKLNSGEKHNCRIIALWKVIRYKRGPAPYDQWWTKDSHPHLMLKS